MATYIENLRARRTAVAAELAALDASQPGGLPDIGGRDGGTDVKHQEYKMNLYAELEKLDKLIADAALSDDAGPFEVETKMNVNMSPPDWSY